MTAAPEIHPSLLIPRVSVEFLPLNGGNLGAFETVCSSEILRRLELASNDRETVGILKIDGRAIDADSLKALNAYLRTSHALNPNGVLPFNRRTNTRSRWDWAMFCAYLDFTFAE